LGFVAPPLAAGVRLLEELEEVSRGSGGGCVIVIVCERGQASAASRTRGRGRVCTLLEGLRDRATVAGAGLGVGNDRAGGALGGDCCRLHALGPSVALAPSHVGVVVGHDREAEFGVGGAANDDGLAAHCADQIGHLAKDLQRETLLVPFRRLCRELLHLGAHGSAQNHFAGEARFVPSAEAVYDVREQVGQAGAVLAVVEGAFRPSVVAGCVNRRGVVGPGDPNLDRNSAEHALRLRGLLG
jgi:hypothetical protein